jgi:hypothetical protein
MYRTATLLQRGELQHNMLRDLMTLFEEHLLEGHKNNNNNKVTV